MNSLTYSWQDILSNLYHFYDKEDYLVTERISNKIDYSVKETDKDFKITIVSPGLKKEDFELILTDKKLKLKMPYDWRNIKEKQDFFFRVPEYVEMEDVSAEYKSGILTIVIVKNKPPETSFKILIK